MFGSDFNKRLALAFIGGLFLGIACASLLLFATQESEAVPLSDIASADLSVAL